jgi:predicted metalloprotease
MRTRFSSSIAAVLAAATIITGAGSSGKSEAMFARERAVKPTIEVTEKDVQRSNEKIGMAYRELVTTWRASFRDVGARFIAPSLVRYRVAARTACGIMRSGNAAYCTPDNTIYFDEVFVALQAKHAAGELGTDGDMAAVGVIAHEMGHAVAIQLGHQTRSSYSNEAMADCLAGAFALEAQRNGNLEDGDVDEAFFGMAAAADPEPQLTGNRMIDDRILMRLARRGHGTEEQRMQHFRAGLEGGAGACLPEFSGRT